MLDSRDVQLGVQRLCPACCGRLQGLLPFLLSSLLVQTECCSRLCPGLEELLESQLTAAPSFTSENLGMEPRSGEGLLLQTAHVKPMLDLVPFSAPQPH